MVVDVFQRWDDREQGEAFDVRRSALGPLKRVGLMSTITPENVYFGRVFLFA